MSREPPAEKEAPAGDLVEDLFAQYVVEVEQGQRPDLPLLMARLPDDDARLRFRALLADFDGLTDSLDEPLHPGARVLERYRIDEELAHGGMGKVFTAFDERLQRPVAIKVLTVASAGRLDAEALLRQEGLLMAALRHPNIVPVYELLRLGSTTALVMELVQGTALDLVMRRVQARAAVEGRPALSADVLRRAIARPVPPGRRFLLGPDDGWPASVARVMLELARTVEAAHAAGVLHRDLKPPNVMLRGDGHPVVLDFGLSAARDAADDPLSEGLFGTAGYVAPEQAESGRTGCDPRTDVYQLGLLLYEMLALRRAFPGEVIIEVLNAVRIGRHEPLGEAAPDVPEALVTVCEKALATDPARRLPSVTAFRAGLEAFLKPPRAARLRWWQRS